LFGLDSTAIEIWPASSDHILSNTSSSPIDIYIIVVIVVVVVIIIIIIIKFFKAANLFGIST
jgi:hypothetical protein